MPKNKTILNIYILEDNPDYLTFIQETVQQYLLIEELPAKIRLATTSATELLAITFHPRELLVFGLVLLFGKVLT